MQEHEAWFAQDIYSEHLAVFNGVNFTRRQIDVMACLVSMRGTKKIAELLSLHSRPISPDTVRTHIQNIMQKLGCNSRETIIDFIEASQKLTILRKYYTSLILESTFEKTLQEISKLEHEETPACVVVYWKNHSLKNFLITRLINHLNQANVSVEIREKLINQKLERMEKLPHALLLLIEKKNQQEDSKDLSAFDSTDLSEQNNYYFAVFEILKKLLPNINFDPLLPKFREHNEEMIKTTAIAPFEISLEKESINRNSKEFILNKEILEDTSEALIEKNINVSKVINPDRETNITEKIRFKGKSSQLLKKNFWVFICTLFFISIFVVVFLNHIYIREYLLNFFYTKNMNTVKNNNGDVRSDLITPAESVTLDRPELIAQINAKFKKLDGVQTVSLVGPGGAGKTTLARHYASQQKTSIIWEINAETHESLKESFEQLAESLAKIEEDKKVLRQIQKIDNSPGREEKIVQFVKDRLSLQPNWFLIYDNVEKFTDIQKYFPQDFSTWGRGQIILTTRDSNIQNNAHIDNVIFIGNLSPQQKFDLFTKIVNRGNSQFLIPAQIEEAKRFLESIPSFPLDISIAAYYLKSTNIPYETYRESIAKYDKEFESIQKNILKEAGNYNKTRYGIVILSLQNIININKDFQDLLLLISLIDSQNIPRGLLDKYKGNTIVDNFIYNLKKHSLITKEATFSSVSDSTFSIHRSSQMLTLLYLSELLNLKKNHQLVKNISETLEIYLCYVRDQEDQQRINSLINHSEHFLSHSKLLSESSCASIESTIGSLYFYLGGYERAKELLERSIIKFKKNDYKPYDKYFDSLVYLGSVYLGLGNFETAKKLLEECVNFNDLFPQNYDKIALALTYLGNVYRELGNYEKAKNLFEKSLTFYKKHFPKNDIKIAWVLAYLGNINKELGSFETAKNLLEESLKTYKKVYGEEHIETAWVTMFLGVVHRELGNYKQSIYLLEKSLIVYKKNFPETYVIIARLVRNLGKSYLSYGNFEMAEEMLNKSFEVMKNNKYPKSCMCLEELAELYLKKSIVESNKNNTKMHNIFKTKSTKCLKEALDTAKIYYPKDSPHILRMQLKLENQKSGIIGK